jgi:hypothetical protein
MRGQDAELVINSAEEREKRRRGRWIAEIAQSVGSIARAHRI